MESEYLAKASKGDDSEKPSSVEGVAPVQSAKPEVIPGSYAAIVYFHGIGEQRRYAEMGRLIDALDLYGCDGRSPQDPTGTIRDVKGRFDVRRGDEEKGNIGHAEFMHIPDRIAPGDEAPVKNTRFRVYEAYWAPETAGGVPAREVLWWIARNLLRPLRLIFTRWRTHARLRMTFLHDLRNDLGEETWRQLLKLNWEFEGLEARVGFPHGSFSEFEEYIRQRQPQDARSALAGATKWRWHVIRSALLYQFILLTAAVAATLGFIAAVVGVMWLLNAISGETWLADLLGDKAKASWPNAIAVTGTLGLQLGLRSFLTRVFGDVVFWASDRETTERYKVRAKMVAVGTATLRQVLEDERCTRVVVVAHSLGTTVAQEALLELGKHNRARNREHPGSGPLRIDLIDQFVTLGSPIDKLHYFVESHVGGGHRYNRLYEELHGDVGTDPFSSNKHPRIHWINMWSKADVISGPLTSPVSMEHSSIRPVNNVEVRTTSFPDPGMSHGGYFGNTRTVAVLFDVLVRGRHTYVSPTTRTAVFGGKETQVPDYDAEDVTSLGSDVWARPIQWAVALMVWLAAAYWLISPSPVASWVGWAAVGLATAIVVGALTSRLRGLVDMLEPVRPEPSED